MISLQVDQLDENDPKVSYYFGFNQWEPD